MISRIFDLAILIIAILVILYFIQKTEMPEKGMLYVKMFEYGDSYGFESSLKYDTIEIVDVNSRFYKYRFLGSGITYIGRVKYFNGWNKIKKD